MSILLKYTFFYFFLYFVRSRYDIRNVHGKYSKFTRARNRTNKNRSNSFLFVLQVLHKFILKDIKFVSINLH